MSFIGKFSICSICGKRNIIASQRNKVWEKRSVIDIYLECKECAAIPLWGRKINNKNN